MLQIHKLNDDQQGNVNIFFYSDISKPKESSYDFFILTELFRSYISNNYCVETSLSPNEIIKTYKQLIKELKKNKGFVIDGYMIAREMNKGYKFGATQKKTP